jgi:hypothetical protein
MTNQNKSKHLEALCLSMQKDVESILETTWNYFEEKDDDSTRVHLDVDLVLNKKLYRTVFHKPRSVSKPQSNTTVARANKDLLTHPKLYDADSYLIREKRPTLIERFLGTKRYKF